MRVVPHLPRPARSAGRLAAASIQLLSLAILSVLASGCPPPAPPAATSEVADPGPGAPTAAAKTAEPGKTAGPPVARTEPAVTARPVIYDSHVHIRPDRTSVGRALQIFERAGVTKFAVKSAGSPGSSRYAASLSLARYLGPRVAFFVNVDWDGHNEPGFVAREVRRLEQAMRDGASGIKVYKALGLGVRDAEGKLWPVDTPRLFPLWKRAGELGAIVAMHTSDPKAFFEPVTPENERWEELKRAPSWSFHGKDYPSRDTLLAQRDALLGRFPETTFLGIHLANNPEDLDYVARLLERHPNLYVDTSARIGEIGRHPAEEVRRFFLRFQDRILFGSDLIVHPRSMQLGSVSLDGRVPTTDDAVAFYDAHRRFFETGQKGIAHPTPSQGDWTVDAIDLPAPVLAKLYRDNAERLIFAPRARWVREHGQPPAARTPGPGRPKSQPGPERKPAAVGGDGSQ